MKRVTGIGGVFFQARDPAGLQARYRTHLGIDVQEWGGAAFTPTEGAGSPTTVWSVVGGNFAPSASPFMVNYRVDDLAVLLQALRDEGCTVLDQTDDAEHGKFGWIMDLEGNKVELWEPPSRR